MPHNNEPVALQSYLRSLVAHMSTSMLLPIHCVHPCMPLGFLQAYAMYPDKDSDLSSELF